MTLDDAILDVLRRAPGTLNEIRNDLRMQARADVARALRRLKYANRAQCNVGRPYTRWHLTNRCPCGCTLTPAAAVPAERPAP